MDWVEKGAACFVKEVTEMCGIGDIIKKGSKGMNSLEVSVTHGFCFLTVKYDVFASVAISVWWFMWVNAGDMLTGAY